MGRMLDAVTFGPARRRRTMTRALAALDRADAAARHVVHDPFTPGRGPRDWTPPTVPRAANAHRKRRQGRRQTFAVAVLVACLIGGPLLIERVPPLIAGAVTSGNFPPPGVGAQRQPLGRPPAAPAGRGGYAFALTQAGTGEPVTWDPCRAIHYVTAGTAPAGGVAVVAGAVARVSAATGLTFVADGDTVERLTTTPRKPYQPTRYGKRWVPLIIDWSAPDRVPDLAGPTIGLGGGQSITDTTGHAAYVTGQVALDTPQLAGVIAAGDADLARAVVMHELGHALGLAHVDDPAQLMYPEAQLRVTEPGAGDLRGLAALGAGRCDPLL